MREQARYAMHRVASRLPPPAHHEAEERCAPKRLSPAHCAASTCRRSALREAQPGQCAVIAAAPPVCFIARSRCCRVDGAIRKLIYCHAPRRSKMCRKCGVCVRVCVCMGPCVVLIRGKCKRVGYKGGEGAASRQKGCGATPARAVRQASHNLRR